MDISKLTLVDVLTYAPWVIVGTFGSLVAWKLGRAIYRATGFLGRIPVKTAGAIGTAASLFFTPVAVFGLWDKDVGLAAGSGGVGLFILTLSILGLIRGRGANTVVDSGLREDFARLIRLAESNAALAKTNDGFIDAGRLTAFAKGLREFRDAARLS